MSRFWTIALLLALAAPAAADDDERKTKKLKPPATLPEISLLDPAGKRWTHTMLAKRGAALMVTVPALSHQSAQTNWHKHLTETRPKGKTPPYIVFVEDMASSWFARAARAHMRRSYKPGVPPLLLLDEKGAARRALGVVANTTVVLAYDKKSRLVRIEKKPTADAARRIWKALAGE